MLFGGSNKINHLPVVPAIDREIGTVNGKHLGAHVPFAHHDNGGIGKIHLVIAGHKSAEPRPVCGKLKVEPKGVALKQLEERIDVHTIGAQEICRFREDGLGGQHRGTNLFHQLNGPRVVGIVAI